MHFFKTNYLCFSTELQLYSVVLLLLFVHFHKLKNQKLNLEILNRRILNDKRLFDIDYPYSFHDIDSIEIKIPQGYSPESIPKDLSLNSKFGSYKISYTADGDKLKVERDYTRFAGRFPASDFSDFTKFYNDIYRADRSRVVLIKKDIN